MNTLTNLPGVFIRDCLDCESPIGEATFDKRGRVTLKASDEELAELRSRAEYYADPYGPPEFGMKVAARAILKHLPPE